MAINYPGPYQMVFHYTGLELPHTMKLNCDVFGTPDPGEDPSLIDILQKGGGVLDFGTQAATFAILLKPLLPVSGGNISHCELFKVTPLSFETQFISAVNFTAYDGTNVAATQTAGAVIFSFRTQEGGIMKIQVNSEIAAAVGPCNPSPTASAYTDLIDYILSDANGFLGRDTSWPIAFRQLCISQNEAVFKTLYR